MEVFMARTYPHGQFPEERAEKTVVRAHSYLRCIGWFGIDEFRRAHHVVLAGPKGGDINLLRGIGVPGDHIHAVDCSSNVNLNQYEKMGVRIYREDVLLTLSRLRRHVDIYTVNLDFCTVLCSSLLDKVAAAFALLKGHETTISVTISGSRESEPMVLKEIDKQRYRHPKAASGHLRGFALAHLLPSWGSLVSANSFYSYQGRGKSVKGNEVVRSMSTTVFNSRFCGRGIYLGSEISRRDLSVGFAECGLRSMEIAPALREMPTRVAAWLAAHTKRGREISQHD